MFLLLYLIFIILQLLGQIFVLAFENNDCFIELIDSYHFLLKLLGKSKKGVLELLHLCLIVWFYCFFTLSKSLLHLVHFLFKLFHLWSVFFQTFCLSLSHLLQLWFHLLQFELILLNHLGLSLFIVQFLLWLLTVLALSCTNYCVLELSLAGFSLLNLFIQFFDNFFELRESTAEIG